MADLSDALLALRNSIAATLYPAGVPAGPGPAISPVVNCGVRIYVGWPASEPLDDDLAAGIVNVSIFPRAGIARDMGPRFGAEWIEGEPPATMTAIADPDAATATFAATPAAAPAISIAAIVIDRSQAHTHVLVPGETPSSLASAFAALISAGQAADGLLPSIAPRSATAAGSVLTVPNAWTIAARVVVSRPERRELRRIEQGVAISIWAPTAALRDRVAIAIDNSIADEGATLTMPNGEVAGIAYGGTAYGEEGRAQPLHRRDLLVNLEYSMTVSRRGEPPIASASAFIMDSTNSSTDTPIRFIVVNTD